MSREQSAESSDATSEDDWEPEYWLGVFHGLLVCARPQCRERVVVVGDWGTQGDGRGDYENSMRLRFAWPALPLVDPPAKTPDAVLERLDEASRVVWADPGSAANGLRRCVEAVLDHQRVAKTALTKARKRRRLSTQERIEAFKAKNATAASSLEAVKWVGNQGSHGDVITASDVIESAEYLDHALRALYDTRDAELTRRVKAVNKARGVSRSGP